MKNKILIPAIILAVLAVFFSFKYAGKAGGDDGSQNEIVQGTIMDIMSQGHYAPRTLDDKFSEMVYNKALESFDYDKKFFTQKEIDQLSPFKDKIDDELKANSLDFFNTINALFVQRIKVAEGYYKELLAQPFTFNGNDSIQLDAKQLKYAANEQELKDRWRTYLKYRVLDKYTALKEDDDKKVKDSAGYKPKDFAALEKEARDNILKVQDRYFKRLEKLNDNDRFAIYMNCITGAEDPHTDYLPPADKKRFDEMMSGSFSGIGASLQQQDDGSIKVATLITGSPAWKTGKLKVDDVIEKVAQGSQPPIDIEGYDMEDAVKIIRGPKGSEVRLTVKHSNGTREVIPIIRDQVDIEETFARSVILNNGDKKIGYIYLPEFYVDFNNPDGRRCSTDMAKEIIKLKTAGVDGIVLDLRNNGGGSLPDVVDIAGLFIGKGPVVQVRSSGNQTMTLSSKMPTPLYTGPLAVMVNGNSASASEILAAALQDYHRAVIVGTTTFGKGTVQKLVGLDPFVSNSQRAAIIKALTDAKNGDAEYDGIGSLKLTIQKFYRIDGGSTQLKGVTPDIMLPDAYDLFDETGERRDSSALPWDKIAAVNYNMFFPNELFTQLDKQSVARIDKNQNFKLIQQAAQRLKKQYDENYMPLNKTKYAAKLKESKDLAKKIDQLDSLNTALQVTNLEEDLARINLDTTSVKKNEDWKKAIKKDIYIAETANIVSDWLHDSKTAMKAGMDAVRSKDPVEAE